MFKLTFEALLLMFMTGAIAAESLDQIRSVADLKEAICSARAREIVQHPEQWLPELVSSVRWNTELSEHFVLHYQIDKSDGNDVLFDSLISELEKQYGELLNFFGIEAGSKREQLALKTRLVCFIVKTDCERTFGTLPDPHLLFYLLDPGKDPNYMNKLRHELAHWVWGRLYGEAPPLFNEGVAVYAEKSSAPNITELDFLANAKAGVDQVPPLKEVVHGDGFWKHKGMYTLGSLWIDFLVKEFGWDQLKTFFLNSDFEDDLVVEHFERVYGEKLETLEFHWRSYLAEK